MLGKASDKGMGKGIEGLQFQLLHSRTLCISFAQKVNPTLFYVYLFPLFYKDVM
jgi:hypothetical protein